MDVPLPPFASALGDGIWCIDTGYHRPHYDAAYLLVDGGRAAFWDTGTNFAVPRLLATLQALGLQRDAVDWVIPSHVHLDHAGGAGLLMQELPAARMLLHPRGLRHLVAPSALQQAVLAIYGAEAVARDTEADRATRIRSHVLTRAEACEKWLPLWRMLTAKPVQEQVTNLRARVLAVRQANLERVELMYQPELATVDPPAHKALVMALVTLTSFESWGALREDFDMAWDSALDVWVSAIDRMLPESP